MDTRETWTSRELRLILSSVHRNSRGGEDSEVLQNVILDEPDSKVFLPPPGYTIQDVDAQRQRGPSP